jgi:hypothetical protein
VGVFKNFCLEIELKRRGRARDRFQLRPSPADQSYAGGQSAHAMSITRGVVGRKGGMDRSGKPMDFYRRFESPLLSI